MTYHDRTTKEAYDKDILDKKVSEDMALLKAKFSQKAAYMNKIRTI